MSAKKYQFGDFLLDTGQKRLFRDGEKVSLQPKAFDILIVLLEKNGAVVSRDELMKTVWKDTFVEEANLRFCIHALRKSLGKKTDGSLYVETLPKHGYRLNAEIREEDFEKRAEIEAPKESASPDAAPPKRSAVRRRLFGAAVLFAVLLLIAALAWRMNFQNQPKNALDFETLAVLPFEAAGENQSDLRIGLADAMITNLSKIKLLKVLPLAAVSHLDGQNFNSETAGKQLKTDAVLSGTYRLDAENVRVTVNLLRVRDGETLWSETFSAARKSGLKLEDEIAVRTARLLSLKIAEIEEESSLAGKNLNREAVEAYLAARKIWRAGELNRRKEMIGLFEKTLSLEPAWTTVYASYAEALMVSDHLLIDWSKAEQIANRTLELDAARAEPHATLGEIYYSRDWNWEKSETAFRRAISLNTDYAPAFFKYSQLLRIQRRFAEAEQQLVKAIEIEPFSPVYHASLCELYSFDQKYEKALAACGYARQIEPDYWLIKKLLYFIYVQKKMYAELDAMILSKLSPAEKAENPLAKAIAGNDLRPFLRFLAEEPSRSGRENPVPKAALYAQLGENQKALENLNKALAVHDPNLPMVNADPSFDSLRREKRLAEIMKQIGLQK